MTPTSAASAAEREPGIPARRRIPAAILVLSVSIFVIGSAELLPMGLLMPIADEYGLSVSTAVATSMGDATACTVRGESSKSSRSASA